MRRSGKVFLIAGYLLVLGSLGLLVFSYIRTDRSAAAAAELTAQLESVLPPRTPGIPEPYTNMEMPAFSIGDQDFIGIVEVPAFHTALPLAGAWDSSKTTSFPCRFWGSVYDGSLILGGADQKGQLDFLDQIEYGESVFITDMTGAEFSYRVERITRSKSADAEVLVDERFDLTIFARDTRSLEYILVRCVAA